MFDELEAFVSWWMNTRALNTPNEHPTNFNGMLSGVVLFRQGQYQVQLFNVQPNCVIEPHIHPNVDSFEVFVGGDIDFMCDDVWYTQTLLGDRIRVTPSSWHGGKFGPRGGCFLSIQKWQNGITPTSVGDDWHDKDGNSSGTASKETKD